MIKFTLACLATAVFCLPLANASPTDTEKLQFQCGREMLHRQLKKSNGPNGQILLQMEQVLVSNGYRQKGSTETAFAIGANDTTYNAKINFVRPGLHGSSDRTEIEVEGIFRMNVEGMRCDEAFINIKRIELKTSHSPRTS